MTLTDDFIAAPTKELACQLSAQAWCTPETGDIIMCNPLAEAFADILLAVAVEQAKALKQAELVNDRLRLSWREDVAAEKARADEAEAESNRLAALLIDMEDQRKAETARADGLYEDVVMYGRANGELKDALADEKARADDLATTLQGTLTSLAAATEELAALKEPPTDGDAAYWHTAWKVLEAELQRDIARYKDSAKAQGTVIFELRGECELAYEQLQAKTAENQSLRSMLIDGTTEGNVLLARYDARAPHPSQGGGE